MTPYFYTLVLLLSCLGLSLQAKGIVPIPLSAPKPPSKPATKPDPKPVSPVAAIDPVKPRVVEHPTPPVASTFSSKGTVRSGQAGDDSTAMEARLARLTAYWASEGDYYTRHGVSATGVHLHGGHCAVDPRIIPYGSVIDIPGLGHYLAVDTGSAVISRTAARMGAHSREERSALVVDLYFESRREAQEFAASGPEYASISWWTPDSTGSDAKEARSLFADENWAKIQNKQISE